MHDPGFFVCVCVCIWVIEGEVLATMEESSRDFLYPGPRWSSRVAEREILMKRSSSFPVSVFCLCQHPNIYHNYVLESSKEAI